MHNAFVFEQATALTESAMANHHDYAPLPFGWALREPRCIVEYR